MSSKTFNNLLVAAISVGILALFLSRVVPNFIRARHEHAKQPCIARLKQIDGAKQQWALENRKTPDDVPRWEEILPYLASSWTNSFLTNGHPACPEGGVYILGRVGENPRCSLGGPQHSLE